MKSYTSCATKRLAILTIISAAVLIAEIICIFACSSNVRLQIGLTMLGGLMSVLFLSCFFVEKNRYLTIDDKKIILPRGAEKNGKMSYRKTIINIDDIHTIKSELHKGDGIISKDTLFHILKLKDGTTIKFTLYAYGKDAEKEILESLKNTFNQSQFSE